MDPREPRPRAPDSGRRSRDKESFLLGVGLDGQDGHRRITHGRGFHLEGGSEETHERMQETIIRVNEKLERKGRSIPESSAEELRDILHDASE